MDAGQSFIRRMLASLAGVALVFGLVSAVWVIYQRLPRDERAAQPPQAAQGGPALLHVHLRRAEIGFPVSSRKIPVQLYPVNTAAARNEFDSERRPGQRFEDFAARLMGGRQPITSEFDERGDASIEVPPGKWWIHATVEGDRELTWRLPIEITGREQSVELTPENAYLRAKNF
jgi:hypothetical protein